MKVTIELPESCTVQNIAWRLIEKLGDMHLKNGGLHSHFGWAFCNCKLAAAIRELEKSVLGY